MTTPAACEEMLAARAIQAEPSIKVGSENDINEVLLHLLNAKLLCHDSLRWVVDVNANYSEDRLDDLGARPDRWLAGR
jgi:hypothetical protein